MRAGRLGALVLGLAGLAGQAALRPRVEARQVEAGLVVARADERAAMTTDVAVPVLALGAFRGLAVDYLWLRTLSLRDRGRYYEARQLAEQICRLQPRLPDVWVYLGHDLAYNMTAAATDPEQRWRWVRNGIELLRDRGLESNPDDPDLLFMLARIYQDKVGSTLDDAHEYMKHALALELDGLLGGEAPAALAAAPDPPALLAADPDARALVDEAAALGVDLPERALDLELAARAADARGAPPGPAAPLPADAAAEAALVKASRGTPAWERVVRSARKEALRRLHGLEAARMVEVDREYGPLDWRGCDAPVVYWAERGLRACERRGDVKGEMLMRRTITAALKNAVRRGRVELISAGVYFGPQVELALAVDARFRRWLEEARERGKALEAATERRGPTEAEVEALTALSSYVTNQTLSRQSYLGEAIVLLAEHGRDAEGRALVARARADYPDEPLFRGALDEVVTTVYARRFADAGLFDSREGVAQLLEATWERAYQQLAFGHDERFRGLDALARASRARWERALERMARDEPEVRRRLGLPYEQLRRRAARRAAEALPPDLQARLAERLGVAPEDLLRAVDDVPLPGSGGAR